MGPNETYELLHSKGNQKNKTKQTNKQKKPLKRQPMEQKKIIANNATDKGLIFKIYKQLI